MKTKPRIEIDLQKVESLAALGLNRQQIADALGISVDTLYNRQRESQDFREAIKRGEAKGLAKVSSRLMEQVDAGNVTAMIFYLKAKGGWREVNRTEVTGADGAPLAVQPVEHLSNDQLLEIARMSEDESEAE